MKTGLGNWQQMLMSDLPYWFLLEVVIRTIIMFGVILLTLRASGKRGIKQLSIFELVLIIGLGSAAGDPMFYEDVGILPAITVFIVVIALYFTATKLADKFRSVEKLLEGEPLYVIIHSRMQMNAFSQSGLSKDEFFAELRLHNIEHLGQVQTVLIETSGELSILYYPDEQVRPGLPIFPPIQSDIAAISQTSLYRSCTGCGYTEEQQSIETKDCCPSCEKSNWIPALQNKRIT